MKTPRERARDCWHPLELGPGWEKRLAANIEAAIVEAVAEERERCCRDMCYYCRLAPDNTRVAAAKRDGEEWYHTVTNGTEWCRASWIRSGRARASGGNGGGEEEKR